MRNYNSSILERNTILNKININPVTIVIIIFSLMFSIIFSGSIIYNLSILSFYCIFILTNNLFNSLFLVPINKFKIFILFSLLFMILSNYESIDILLYTVKILTLLLLSSFLNKFLDYGYVLNFLDLHLSKIKPVILRIYTRKILYSFILGIKSVPELFRIGENIIKLKIIKGFKKHTHFISKINENINLLRTLFIQSFIMAKNTDLYFNSKGFSFSTQRSFYSIRKFHLNDYFLIAVSIILIVL